MADVQLITAAQVSQRRDGPVQASLASFSLMITMNLALWCLILLVFVWAF